MAKKNIKSFDEHVNEDREKNAHPEKEHHKNIGAKLIEFLKADGAPLWDAMMQEIEDSKGKKYAGKKNSTFMQAFKGVLKLDMPEWFKARSETDDFIDDFLKAYEKERVGTLDSAQAVIWAKDFFKN